MDHFLARTDEIVVEELDGGLVIYDTRADVAHWLDSQATGLWRACAEARTEAEILGAAGASAADCQSVLSRLIDLGLIDRQSPSGHSRRAVLRSAAKVGLAGAVAAPVISAVVPVAAAHASVRSSFTQLTPGYWKNHELQTTALLPQSLGTYYTVKSFTDATAVFDNMNNGNATALGGLAGQLLAAELNVAGGGGAPCVQAAISHANALLSSLFYVGPGPSYNLASWQRQDAIALGTTLANYNSGSSTC